MREVFINVADFDIWWGVRVRESKRGGGEGIFFRRFRSQIIFEYTAAVRSQIYSSLLYAWC